MCSRDLRDEKELANSLKSGGKLPMNELKKVSESEINLRCIWNIFREHEFQNFVDFERKSLLNFRNLSFVISNFFLAHFCLVTNKL